jgi:hypothetical protein
VTAFDGAGNSSADELTVTKGKPQLVITKAGNQIVLRWSTSWEGFQLEGRDSVGPSSSWIGLGATANQSGGFNMLTLDALNPKRFFRLNKH